jgi:hypothetical protein
MEELKDGLYRTGSRRKNPKSKITIGLLDAFNNRKLSTANCGSFSPPRSG